MYTVPDFRTKKDLKEAVASGEKVIVYDKEACCGLVTNGEESVEGPHYPEPHRWQAKVTITDGKITKVE